MVAKVESDGKTFFVPEGKEIHQLPEFDGLPCEARKWLDFHKIIGTVEGFIDRTFEKKRTIDKEIIGNNQGLLLPNGIRITPHKLPTGEK